MKGHPMGSMHNKDHGNEAMKKMTEMAEKCPECHPFEDVPVTQTLHIRKKAGKSK